MARRAGFPALRVAIVCGVLILALAANAGNLARTASESSPTAQSESQASKYPLVLTVTSTSRRTHKGATTTMGAGVLTSKDDPTKPPENISFQCDTGVYSHAGKNIYPARLHKPYQLRIAVREIGSEKIKEFTCKY